MKPIVASRAYGVEALAGARLKARLHPRLLRYNFKLEE